MPGYVQFQRLARRILAARAAKRNEHLEFRHRLAAAASRGRIEVQRPRAA
jgi:hypothetical protein